MNKQSQMHLDRQKVSDPLIVLEGSAPRSGKSPLTSDLRKQVFTRTIGIRLHAPET